MANRTGPIASSYAPLSWTLPNIVDLNLMNYLTNKVTRNSGAIYMENGLNTNAVTFANGELVRAANSTWVSFSEIVDCSFNNLSSFQASAVYINNNQSLRITTSRGT